MSRRRHFGNCTIRGQDTVNLGRCDACGTCNPSIPGAGLVEKCAGCGSALETATVTVTSASFTPPVAHLGEANEGHSASTHARRRRNDRRLMRSTGMHVRKASAQGQGPQKPRR